MPIFDVQCSECGKVQEDVWLKINEEPPICSECSIMMQKIVNCTNFKLLYDPKKDTVGWSWDGYATTQYWKDVKEQRAQGKKVKACNEN